jgi:LysM repeat protein
MVLALLIPVAVATLLFTQVPWVGLASPSTHQDETAGIASKRPAASNPAPPPTLAPPATPEPSATPLLVANATPTPRAGGTYVVQPGDELKLIAAEYNLSLGKLIAANDIPDPDSLQVGQELHIPST